jgi:hypothetical protein
MWKKMHFVDKLVTMNGSALFLQAQREIVVLIVVQGRVSSILLVVVVRVVVLTDHHHNVNEPLTMGIILPVVLSISITVHHLQVSMNLDVLLSLVLSFPIRIDKTPVTLIIGSWGHLTVDNTLEFLL